MKGLALAMYKSGESNGAFEMLNKALKLAQRENRVTEEQNIKILIAQMHVVKVLPIDQLQIILSCAKRMYAQLQFVQWILYFVIQGDLEAASQHFQNLINANPRDFRPYLCQVMLSLGFYDS